VGGDEQQGQRRGCDSSGRDRQKKRANGEKHAREIGERLCTLHPRMGGLDPLTAEQREIRDLVRTLAREHIAPRAAEIDKSAEFPWDVVELLRENELFGIMFDEEYGGIGASALMTLVTIEELSKVCATSGLIIAVQELGSLGIKLAGNEDQKRRFLPKLASGEWLAAYALTEPGSGSDSAAMRSTAQRDGDAYILNGGKRFITNAGVASLYVVFAKTDAGGGHAGISAFVVEADAPGFEVGRIEPKMGIKGSTTGEIFFNDCRVPAENLLGEEGQGFRLAMRILDRSRPGIGAQGLGLAQGATDYALDYAKHRETMGKPIAQHQLIAAMLADMETKCEAARGLLYKVGQLIDDGDESGALTKLSAMAKLYCTEIAMDVTTDAVQVLGGYGYIQEYPVERMMRDAKITQIYEGTNQIQRLVIAREMLRENRSFLLAGVA
jgi:alkylation response protein AidB-like acyl-CoA dehydrogenase